MVASGQTNQRQDRRVPLVAKVNITFDDLESFFSGFSVNISRGGVFISTNTPLDLDTRIKLAIRLERGASLIEGEGVVVRSTSPAECRTGQAPGMAISFATLTEKSRQLIDKIVSNREKDILY